MSIFIPQILENFNKRYSKAVFAAASVINIEKHFKGRPIVNAVTIDADYSKDLDDAIYAYREGEFHIIEGSIADVTEFVHRNSVLDRDALKRCSSVYMQEGVIHMFISSLSTDKFSLNHQTNRAALTARIKLNSSFDPVDIEIFESVVYNKCRLDYEKFYKYINNPSHELSSDLNYFMYLAKELYKKRGHTYNFSDDDRKIGYSSIEMIQEGSPSFVVQEFMIFLNKCVSIWCRERGINTTYRNHMPEQKGKKYMGQMDRAQYMPNMTYHLGLELDDYLHFTSPIRRYADIVVHRQIKAYLNPSKWQAYTYEEIKALCLYINEQIYNLKKMQAVKELEFEKKNNIDISKQILKGTYKGDFSSIPIHLFTEILEKFMNSPDKIISGKLKKEVIKRLESDLIKNDLLYNLFLYNDAEISNKANYCINKNKLFKSFFVFLEDAEIGFRTEYNSYFDKDHYNHIIQLFYNDAKILYYSTTKESNKNIRKELSKDLFIAFYKKKKQILKDFLC